MKEMLNKVSLMGRISKDPEPKVTTSDISVVSFSLAVESRFKNSQGEKTTDFIDCVAWRNTADFISRYFTKGRMMVVSGYLKTESWLDNSGKTHKATKVIVEEAYFGDSKREDSAQATQRSYAPAPEKSTSTYQNRMLVGFEEISPDADLPF